MAARLPDAAELQPPSAVRLYGFLGDRVAAEGLAEAVRQVVSHDQVPQRRSQSARLAEVHDARRAAP